jgi:hypothetical protein
MIRIGEENMNNRAYLEQKIFRFNGNKYVYGILPDGTKLTLQYEEPLCKEGEFIDVDSGMIFSREELEKFENCIEHPHFLRTKNHIARNHHQFVTSGKNYKEEKGKLAHLIN